MTLFEVAQELVRRLTGTFLRDADGQRPVYGGTAKFQERSALARSDSVLRVLPRRQWRRAGASHQTGWTGLVAPLLDIFGRVDAKTLLETERGACSPGLSAEQVGGEEKERGERVE